MTYKIPVLDITGKKKSDITFSADIFADDAIHTGLIHEYVVMYLANQRQSAAHTKTRGEVKRSGRKLYNQKGGGRARVGDAGSPIRRKGGVAMGPRKERNWSKAMPQKMRNRALSSAITLKLQSDNVVALLGYDAGEIKTKEAYTMIQAIGLQDKKTLIVFGDRNDIAEKSLRNISSVNYTSANLVNAYEVMCTKKVLFVGNAVDILQNRLSK